MTYLRGLPLVFLLPRSFFFFNLFLRLARSFFSGQHLRTFSLCCSLRFEWPGAFCSLEFEQSFFLCGSNAMSLFHDSMFSHYSDFCYRTL